MDKGLGQGIPERDWVAVGQRIQQPCVDFFSSHLCPKCNLCLLVVKQVFILAGGVLQVFLFSVVPWAFLRPVHTSLTGHVPMFGQVDTPKGISRSFR